ncbi:MAG: THUMP domain-containing class I SAM-dependent RNA methyltransferase [Christensenellales bacterium]
MSGIESNEKLLMLATSSFGLEALVAQELRQLKIEPCRTADARVYFYGGLNDLAKACMWLRCADRVLLVLGEFKAYSFEELFEGVKKLPWEDWLPQNAAFPVRGKSAKSKLFSVRDCQAITKKAIVERLKQKYKTSWFQEDGVQYTVEVGILNDTVTMALDPGGSGLHRRGYRTGTTEAPLRENLAAALVLLSRYRAHELLLDPTCGSGTIPIEAAMIARNIAPGANRDFEGEQWMQTKPAFAFVRQEARDAVKNEKVEIIGCDIDDEALALARINARQAQVEKDIQFICRDVAQTKLTGKGVVISNPPYGERMGEINEARKLYKTMGGVFLPHKEYRCSILTSDLDFERYFGRRADKKRKLYNGNIQCFLYQYFEKK